MTQQLRLAELMTALSLATDLGMGQPPEQPLRTCLLAIELAERMGLTKGGVYVALLRFLGRTVDAHKVAEIFGGDDLAERRAAAPLLGSPPEFARVILREQALSAARVAEELEAERAPAGSTLMLCIAC